MVNKFEVCMFVILIYKLLVCCVIVCYYLFDFGRIKLVKEVCGINSYMLVEILFVILGIVIYMLIEFYVWFVKFLDRNVVFCCRYFFMF